MGLRLSCTNDDLTQTTMHRFHPKIIYGCSHHHLHLSFSHTEPYSCIHPHSISCSPFLGCLKAGVVAVPCFPPNPARKDTLLMFSRITDSSGAKFVLTSSEYNHLKKLAGVKDVFTKFTRARHTAAAWPEQLEWIITDSMASGKSNSKNKTLPTPAKTDLAFLQVSILCCCNSYLLFYFWPSFYLTPQHIYINKISTQADQRRSPKES